MREIRLLFSCIILCLSFIFAGVLTGCGNMTMLDTNYTFNKAIIKMPDDSLMEIEIKEWCDYEGEQIQLTDKETGNIYLVNSVNCVLISDEN